ncbi:hypothetical protein GCM10010174_30230 [Kutzneria viridogrisea]|uniref:DNA primase/polymerase bifunctional N-terminal domain-containing protein n=2 Tax=Kutzneria TaxID=43356 RepID=W5VXR3_9PSEU|nr:hypothetical protein [Kutzneria albida]AHH93633.1 hypothetical protein KALB_256 [Kutzneria albida DSM 43870]MBA8928983.1 hypothetical protein [Kutzneria viridogrisea]
MPEHESAQKRRAHDAACDYAHLAGWRLVPGATWDGARYTRGHAALPATELEPLFSKPTNNFRRVNAWWNVAPYAVLAPTGEQFDVISAPLVLGVAATRTGPLLRSIAPVSLSPERMRFLVTPGVPLHPELPGVELISTGSFTPLPPTRVPGGALTWWISPKWTDWRPGDPLAVQAALWEAAQSWGALQCSPS